MEMRSKALDVFEEVKLFERTKSFIELIHQKFPKRAERLKILLSKETPRPKGTMGIAVPTPTEVLKNSFNSIRHNFEKRSMNGLSA